MENLWPNFDFRKGMLAYWTFNEEAGQSRLDSHNSFHLSEAGGTVPNTIGGLVWGQRDGCAAFSPTAASYLRILSTPLNLTGKDMTVTFWLRVESMPALDDYYVVFFKSVPGAEISVKNVEGTLRLRFTRMYQATPLEFEIVSEDEIPLHRWTHIRAWTEKDENLMGVSINNGTPKTAVTEGVPQDTSGGTTAIGCRGDEVKFLDGAVDEMGYWKRPLSESEATVLYERRIYLLPSGWTKRVVPTYRDFLPKPCKSIRCCR